MLHSTCRYTGRSLDKYEWNACLLAKRSSRCITKDQMYGVHLLRIPLARKRRETNHGNIREMCHGITHALNSIFCVHQKIYEHRNGTPRILTLSKEITYIWKILLANKVFHSSIISVIRNDVHRNDISGTGEKFAKDFRRCHFQKTESYADINFPGNRWGRFRGRIAAQKLVS